MVSIVKSFIFYYLVKQVEFLLCRANPVGVVNKGNELTCGQYGFHCINSHEYELCLTTDEVEDNVLPSVTHTCPQDMLCDEENESYCSLPDEDRDSLILIGKSNGKCPAMKDILKSSDISRAVAVKDEPYVSQGLQSSSKFVNNFNFHDNTAADADDGDNEVTEMCITPPAPFDCDMLGYFPGMSKYCYLLMFSFVLMDFLPVTCLFSFAFATVSDTSKNREGKLESIRKKLRKKTREK